MSDTMLFIKDYLTLISEDKNFYKKKHNLDLIEKLIDSKMVFLANTGEIVTLGKFIEDTNGILYSNASYLKTYYSYVYGYGGKYDSYDKYWDVEEYEKYTNPSTGWVNNQTSTGGTPLALGTGGGYHEEKMMWLPECYYYDGKEYYELPGYEFLIDKWDNVYEYDFETDDVWFFGRYKVFNENLEHIYYDDDIADYVRVGSVIQSINRQEKQESIIEKVKKVLPEIKEEIDDVPFEANKGA